MNLNEYQKFTASTAVYTTDVVVGYNGYQLGYETPSAHMPEMYPVLALAEEAGEVAGKYAKYIRKHGAALDERARVELKTAVIDELGDVLYNISEVARQLGVPLQEVLDRNVEKLKDRVARNVIVGEGDNR